jgi:hypothetical protein
VEHRTAIGLVVFDLHQTEIKAKKALLQKTHLVEGHAQIDQAA